MVIDGSISIVEIGRIEGPISWSLCVMWPFADPEHLGTHTPDNG